MGRVFANGPRDLGSIPVCVIPKTLKMVLDTSLLNTQQYKVLWRVKWSNSGKGATPSPTRRCSSYLKGSLLVTLDYGRQHYFTFIIIIIYSLRVFCIDFSWWSFTRVWVTASQFKSSGRFSVFWPFSVMLYFWWSPLVLQLTSTPVPLIIL